MAWTPQSDYASVNAKLRADPRFQQAQSTYMRTLAANPIPTIMQQRAGDDGGQGADDARFARTQAAQAFTKTATDILKSYGITDFERLGFHADGAQVAYEPPDHSLRNILIPMAAIATAGIVGGLIGGPAAAGTAGTALGPTTAGSMAATSSIVAGGAVPSSLAVGGGTGVAGLLTRLGSYAPLLNVGGNLVNGYLQRRSDDEARDEQRKYLEEALAYAKEQDARTWARTDRLDAQEAQRYGDYQGRIRGFIDNGQSSNDTMAGLLGLPARPGGYGGSYGGGRPDDTGDWQQWFESLTGGKPPTPDQLVAYEPQITAAGGKVLRNAAGVAGKIQLPGSTAGTYGPIVDVIQSAGTGGKAWQWLTSNTGQTAGARLQAAIANTPTTPSTPSAPMTTQPLARTTAASVQMRAPDGSIKTIPATQVQHWTDLGATLLGAAA